MPIVYACAGSHAPGLTAWAGAASPDQSKTLFGGFETIRAEMRGEQGPGARVEALAGVSGSTVNP